MPSIDDPDAAGNSVLYYAALCGHEHLVNALLGKGAWAGGKNGIIWTNALTAQIRAHLEAAEAGVEAKKVSAPAQAELEEDYGYGLIDSFCDEQIDKHFAEREFPSIIILESLVVSDWIC